jgi:hypothetical protein
MTMPHNSVWTASSSDRSSRSTTSACEHADAPHPLGLLRARRERPPRRCAAKQSDELPSSHVGHEAPLADYRRVSRATGDRAAQWTGAMRGPPFFAYADNYLIDVKFGIIMDVQATRAIRQAEVGAAKTMIERTEESFAIKLAYLAADTAYGFADTLNWIVNEKKIAPPGEGAQAGGVRGSSSLLSKGVRGAGSLSMPRSLLLDLRPRSTIKRGQ